MYPAIPTRRLEEFVAGVERAGVSLARACVDEAKDQTREDPAVRMPGTIVIRFVSDEPDLRIPTTAVPG